MDQDLTLDLPLTGLPVIDASNLNLGFKVRIHKFKQFHVIHFNIVEVPLLLATCFQALLSLLLYMVAFNVHG